MFTGFAEHVVTLLAGAAAFYPLGADAESVPAHPLLVLAEPSTLTLAIIGAGVMAVSHRVRRTKRLNAQSSQSTYAKKNASHADEQPRRGAA